MLNNIWQQVTLIAALTLIALALSACRSGGSDPDPVPPIKSTLGGQLQQDAVAGVTAPAGSFIRNARLSLLSGDTVVGSALTDNAGQFDFADLDAGSYTLRLEIDGSVDLDDDGDNDVLIINMPVTIIANSVVVFNSSITGIDIDGDGEFDSIDVEALLTDNKGRNIRRLMRLLHRLGKLQVDTDNDGDFDDDDLVDDFDNDGVPDNAQGSLNSLHGGVLRGSIDAIDDDSITVRGITFSIDSQTGFKVRGNRDAGLDDFEVGDSVHIHARWTGESWAALMIKASGPGSGGGADDPDRAVFHGEIDSRTESSLTIEGRVFEFDTETDWVILGDPGAGENDFALGDFVIIFATENGDDWLATRVVLVKAGEGEEPVIDEFSGAISLLSATSLTVGSQVIQLDSQTEWKLEDGTVSSPAAFSVGDLVVVSVQQQGSAWLALTVTMDEELPLSDTFSGLITIVSETSLTLHGGLLFTLNGETLYQNADGSPASSDLFDSGDFVLVEAEQDGTVWIATVIKLLDDEPLIDQFTAPIVSITGDQLSIDGQDFVIDEVSHFMFDDGSDADPAGFDAGDLVMIEARQDGSSWHALHITFIDDNDTEPLVQVFSGSITALTELSMTVGADLFTLNSGTSWYLADGSAAAFEDFGMDDSVQVIAEQSGLAWTALRINMQ